MAETNERRALAARLADAWRVLFNQRQDQGEMSKDWYDRLMLVSAQSKAGPNVTQDTALQATVVLACVRVIAEGVAQTPWALKRLQDDGRSWEPDEQHPISKLLRKPNSFQTGYEFKETLTMHAALTGNGRAAKIRNSLGNVIELIPLLPANVVARQRDDYSKFYELTTRNGAVVTLEAKDVLDIPGPSWDGVTGLNAVRMAREAIGLSMAAEESHARLHGNGVRMSGILSSPTPLSPESAKRIAEDWREAFAGSRNAYKVPVLESGLDFKPMSMTAVDAQHLETRRFQIEEICRAMRVFPQMVMSSDKTTTFASAEQFFLAHVNHTLAPWLQRWAERLDLHLLPPTTERKLWLQFDLNGLAPGDASTRARYYAAMLNAGIMTPNEAREREGLNPVEGGDELRSPLNLAPLAQDKGEAGDAGDTPPEPKDNQE